MNTDQSLSDVTSLLSEMQRAGVNVDQACRWIARAIEIGKTAQAAALAEERQREPAMLPLQRVPYPVVQQHENIKA